MKPTKDQLAFLKLFRKHKLNRISLAAELGESSDSVYHKVKRLYQGGLISKAEWEKSAKVSKVSAVEKRNRGRDSVEMARARNEKAKEARRMGTVLAQKEREVELLTKEVRCLRDVHESSTKVKEPSWVLKSHAGDGLTGVPTLLLSDLHWSEVVDPKQIGGVNEYNLAIANERFKYVIEMTIDLCIKHIAKPNYPGIVVALDGDIFSGDIHEELQDTNEVPTLVALLDAQAAIKWGLKRLADAFGNVFVPSVPGNHGRTSRKPRCKDAVYTNYDWLLAKELELSLKDDKRITFRVSDSLDTQYRVYNTGYLLTHGDQFKGGSGIAGIQTPLALGNHRKSKRQSSLGLPYDWMLLGHFHQWMVGNGFIVNNSLKGYDEFAFKMNFPFSYPGQGLWITHPRHGITYTMPIEIRPKVDTKTEWVSVPVSEVMK